MQGCLSIDTLLVAIDKLKIGKFAS